MRQVLKGKSTSKMEKFSASRAAAPAAAATPKPVSFSLHDQLSGQVFKDTAGYTGEIKDAFYSELAVDEEALQISDEAKFSSVITERKSRDGAEIQMLETKLEEQKGELIDLKEKMRQAQPALDSVKEAEQLRKKQELLEKQIKWHQDLPQELSFAMGGSDPLEKKVLRLEEECALMRSEIEAAKLSKYVRASVEAKKQTLPQSPPADAVSRTQQAEEEDILQQLFYRYDNAKGYLDLNSLAKCLEELFGPKLATQNAVTEAAKIVLNYPDLDGNCKIALLEFYRVFEHLDQTFTDPKFILSQT